MTYMDTLKSQQLNHRLESPWNFKQETHTHMSREYMCNLAQFFSRTRKAPEKNDLSRDNMK